MGFNPSNGGGIAGADDVALSAVQADEVLSYDDLSAKWQNKAGLMPTVESIPAGSTITVQKTGASWPARPTSRADVTVIWKGPDPSPSIAATGTSGMRDNIDMRFVTD